MSDKLEITDKEDNSFEPVISENKGQNEEGNTEENGDTSDNMDEMFNLLGNWGVTGADVWGKGGNAA